MVRGSLSVSGEAGEDLFVVYIVFPSFLLSQQTQYLSLVVLNKHCLVVRLLHLPLPLNAFGDPHIWPTINKDVSQWPFLRELCKHSAPPLNTNAQMACLMTFFFPLTRCQYVVLLLKGLGLKLESCSGLSLDLLPKMLSKTKCRPDAWHFNGGVHITKMLVCTSPWTDIKVAKSVPFVLWYFGLILLTAGLHFRGVCSQAKCLVCLQDTGVRKENGASSVWAYQEIQDKWGHQVRKIT